MDARNLIETLKGRGLSLRVEGDRIKVEAPHEPDPETKALLWELRQHREEVKLILAAPSCWNCGAMMTQTKDIYGEEVSICVPCTRSSEDPPLPGNIRAWEVERVIDAGKLRAVKICSALLEDHLWLILGRSFEPKDGLAIYYAEEIPLLKNKTPEELREIHKVKLAFPGCRVIQEGAEQREAEKVGEKR